MTKNAYNEDYTFISKIGDVSDFNNKYTNTKVFKVNDVIGDGDYKLVMPFNTNNSIFELAKNFGLWESSNGINVAGKDIMVLEFRNDASSLDYFITNEAVLVGDRLNSSVYGNKTVIYAENTYIYETRKWNVLCCFGDLEKPKSFADVNILKYYESMLNSLSVMQKELLALFITIATAFSLMPPPYPVLATELLGMITKTKMKIDGQLKTEEESSYGL